MLTPLDLVWLWGLLAPACCQAEWHRAEKNVSPVVNMSLDARTKVLTWNSRDNVTEETCIIKTPGDNFTLPAEVREDSKHLCKFPNALLHQDAVLSVTGTSNGASFKEILIFKNSGKNGSGAVNFSCLIYNIQFMNCSWAPGPAAPPDVHYQLRVWTAVLEHDNTAECPHYIEDSAGTRVGCHFDTLSELRGPQFFFFLNGTSQEVGIPFLDVGPIEGYKMEKYNPPSNITSQYNGSNYVIQWENPRRKFESGSHMLVYQLDIRKEGRSRDPISQEGQERNLYVVPSSEAYGQHTLRVRVRHKRSGIWSEWSERLHYGAQEPSWDDLVILLAVTTAVALTVVLMLLFRRFSLRQMLFPPVPQVKHLFPPNTEMAWQGNCLSTDTEEPECLVVEETG